MVGDSLTLTVTIVTMAVFYGVLPLLVLIHELGHALAVIRAGRRPVVAVGKRPPMIGWRFRRFDLSFHPRLALEHFYPRTPKERLPKEPIGFCSFETAGLTVGQLRTICSAGPHASVLAGFLLAAVTWLLPTSSVVFWIVLSSAVISVIEGLGNLWPATHEGRFFNDGKTMEALRGLDESLVPAPALVRAITPD